MKMFKAKSMVSDRRTGEQFWVIHIYVKLSECLMARGANDEEDAETQVYLYT